MSKKKRESVVRSKSVSKSVSLSTRIAQEDAEFLAGLNIEGANTSSEKLRTIIMETRKRQQGMQDYKSSFHMYQSMLAGIVIAIREMESEQQIHSELLSRVIDWVPDLLAFITSVGAQVQKTQSLESLEYMEKGVTERCFRLMESILQIGISKRNPCYDPQAITKRLPELSELIKVLEKRA